MTLWLSRKICWTRGRMAQGKLPWSEEEDDRIRQLFWNLSANGTVDWDALAARLGPSPGRTGKVVQARASKLQLAWNRHAARPYHQRSVYVSIASMSSIARHDRQGRRRYEANQTYDRDGTVVLARRHPNMSLSDGGAVATRMQWDGRYRTAASASVMREGRHFAQFTVLSGRYAAVGVVRPTWTVGSGAGAQHADGHLFYWSCDGACFPGGRKWDGMASAAEPGDRIGLLLDLSKGTLSVHKNDEWLGEIASDGLGGEYSWAVSLCETGERVRLEALPVPDRVHEATC